MSSHTTAQHNMAMAGLLTHNPTTNAFPSLYRPTQGHAPTVACMFASERLLTAAGLSGICTRFPFNRQKQEGLCRTVAAAKVGVFFEIAIVFSQFFSPFGKNVISLQPICKPILEKKKLKRHFRKTISAFVPTKGRKSILTK